MNKLYGKNISVKYKDELRTYFNSLSKKPILSVVEIGEISDNGPYLKSIFKLAYELGVIVKMYRVKLEVSEVESDVLVSENYKMLYPGMEYNFIYTNNQNLKTCIELLLYNLSNSVDVNGILLMSKVKYGLSYESFLNDIDYLKDVDCVTPKNVLRLFDKGYSVAPCTPLAVLTMLHENDIEVAGRHCVVLGRSNIVGKPLSLMLLHEDATVTTCHTKTNDLQKLCNQSDILISAVGIPHFITKDKYNSGTIIDVGITVQDGKILGDVETPSEEDGVMNYTPVPGGIGPLTTLMLFKNLKILIEKQKEVVEE